MQAYVCDACVKNEVQDHIAILLLIDKRMGNCDKDVNYCAQVLNYECLLQNNILQL